MYKSHLPPWLKICRRCLISLDFRLVWLSEANYIHWSCLLIRTGLDLTPMDNQSVVCTHFAEQYLDSKIDYCVWSKLNINNHSVKESFVLVTFSSYMYRHVYIHRCVYIPVYIYDHVQCNPRRID